MTPEQLSFDLPVREALGRDAFFVAPPNALALAEIDRWRHWPERKLALVGPAGAGKSHLAAVWAAEAEAVTLKAPALPEAGALDGRAVVVEEAGRVAGDRTAEEALLHLHNHVLATGGSLLLTDRIAPARWPVALPDLASRMRATPVALLEAPDDTLLAVVLVKLFDDRQIAVSPNLVRYVVPRIERSFAAAQRFVAEIDARALATGQRIGQALAADVLARHRTDTADSAPGRVTSAETTGKGKGEADE